MIFKTLFHFVNAKTKFVINKIIGLIIINNKIINNIFSSLAVKSSSIKD